ncbi:hypothetical protein WSS15_23230 [Acetobacter pasteurianus]|uniref:hypothetical protein n=1 Tax=Acetobacter pasteurianus TaxID=438 RepID=UPI0022C391E1|nr:hypothetical protein [Acetobacter pasteurianus]GLH29673.1 hypothetical protein WSS15_23230 [Acetobacter pasteurianus]
MRTRKEQVCALACALFNKHTDIDECIAIANKYTQEAEERARAECAADTRRLEWLLSRTHYGIPGFDPKVSGRSPSERKEALIRAIDAAMEGGK